jgi:uracil phosphoribosyltransferase
MASPLTVVDHPLIRQAVTRLRDRATPTREFRSLLDEVAQLMAFEVTRDLAVRAVRVRTPLATTRGWTLRRSVVLAPVLRAGLGMLPGFLGVLPAATVAVIGLRRDETTLATHTYLTKVPDDLSQSDVIVLDPMLATGGSASTAIALLRTRRARNIRLASLVAAPPGVKRVLGDHPGTRVFTAALDARLDRRGFIVPGLGDAGDRVFGA